MIVLTSLGVWQLRRAGEKQAIEMALKERGDRKPLQIGNTQLQAVDGEYRKGIARGRFDNKHTLFLDNQVYRGQAGYYVLTPLRLDGSENAILVNRGWVPANLYRQQLPQIEDTPRSLITIHGTLRRPFKAPLFLGGEESWGSAGWPKLIQYIDISKLQPEVGYTLQPLVLQLASDEPYGFVRQWPPALTVGPQRHIAYAIQWFAMAFIAMVVCVILYRRTFSGKQQSSRDKGK